MPQIDQNWTHVKIFESSQSTTTQYFPGVSHNIHMERPELVHDSVDNYLRRRKIAPVAGEAAVEAVKWKRPSEGGAAVEGFSSTD